MAVDAKKIKERLRNLFPKANLSNKRLDEISARLAKKPADDAEETAIDQVINDANDFMPFEDIAKEDDRIRSLEARAKQEQPQKPDGNDKGNDDPAPPKPDDAPAWAKSIMETNQKLLDEVNVLKTGKITENKKESARKIFTQSETLKGLKENVQENWFNRINVDSETPVEDQIKALEEEFQELVQHHADSKGYSNLPPDGNGGNKPSDAELDEVADAI